MPEEICSAGEEGVDELHDDVLEPESGISEPAKLGMELLGFSIKSSPGNMILGLVVRRIEWGESVRTGNRNLLTQHWCSQTPFFIVLPVKKKAYTL